MKVLLVHNHYQQFGGEDSVVRAEQELLERHGDEVLLYSRHSDEIKSFTLPQKALFLPQTVHSGRTASDITATVNSFKPDVAFIHNVFPLISPSVYSRLADLGVPSVQVMHNYRPFCPNGLFFTHGRVCEACKDGNYLNAVSNKCYKESYVFSALYALSCGVNRSGMMERITAVVCLNQFVKAKLMEIGVAESKLHVRPNFVYAPPLPASRNFEPGHYILFMGRLSAEKGLLTLLRGFAALPGVKLKIAGTGPLEPELKTYAREKQLRNVEFLGFVSGDQKLELVRGALAMILPSEWYENFPIGVLDAYMAAKPMIGSRIGGLPDVIQDGKTGLLFEKGNDTDLVAKVKYMVGHPQEAVEMGRCGRVLTETVYGPEQAYRNLMSIFDHARGIRREAA